MRWLIAVMLAVFVTGGDADAQAFKPRGGAKATAKPAAKKASPFKKAGPKKAKPKKGSRAAESSARPDDLTPDDSPLKKKSGSSSDEDADDFVRITDD